MFFSDDLERMVFQMFLQGTRPPEIGDAVLAYRYIELWDRTPDPLVVKDLSQAPAIATISFNYQGNPRNEPLAPVTELVLVDDVSFTPTRDFVPTYFRIFYETSDHLNAFGLLEGAVKGFSILKEGQARDIHRADFRFRLTGCLQAFADIVFQTFFLPVSPYIFNPPYFFLTPSDPTKVYQTGGVLREIAGTEFNFDKRDGNFVNTETIEFIVEQFKEGPVQTMSFLSLGAVTVFPPDLESAYFYLVSPLAKPVICGTGTTVRFAPGQMSFRLV